MKSAVLIVAIALTLCSTSCSNKVARPETVVPQSAGGLVSQKPPYEFDDLDAAMGFVISCIKSDDVASLIKAMKHERKVQPYLERNRHAFERLKSQHAATPYEELTKGLSFPSNSTEFKVGGHGKQFGHIHIDFEKRGTKWYLKSIWDCR